MPGGCLYASPQMKGAKIGLDYLDYTLLPLSDSKHSKNELDNNNDHKSNNSTNLNSPSLSTPFYHNS